jgi:hypothetical protein
VKAFNTVFAQHHGQRQARRAATLTAFVARR